MKQKIIGLYQLITGIFGVILLLFSVSAILENPGRIFTYVLGLLLFSGVAYSGYALINNFKNGVKYSIIAQALQVISITFIGIRYLFTGSAFLAIVIGEGIHIKSQIAPIAYSISLVSPFESFEIKIFVVPVILIFFPSFLNKTFWNKTSGQS